MNELTLKEKTMLANLYYDQLREKYVAELRTKVSRYDCISFCIGYYGCVVEECWLAINRLYREGLIDA